MTKGFDTKTGAPIDLGTLWAIDHDWLKDPVKQFSDYVATHNVGSGF